MSSDQYSEKPLPAHRTCPYCGESIAAKAKMCWLCTEKFGVREGAPEPMRRARKSSAPMRSDAAADSAAWALLGIVAVFLICAMAFEVPGVLIVLLVLAAPAMVRALVAVSQKSDDSTPTSAPSFLLMFLNSLGIAAVVGLASFIAFFATCFVVCLGGLSMGALDKKGSDDFLLTCSVGGGLVVGLVVAGFLFRAFWPRKN